MVSVQAVSGLFTIVFAFTPEVTGVKVIYGAMVLFAMGIGSLADPEDLDVQPDAGIHESMIIAMCQARFSLKPMSFPHSPAKSSSYQAPLACKLPQIHT